MENIHNCWKDIFNRYVFPLDELYAGEDPVYPSKEQVFRVFQMDVAEIRVVLLGQDPYHGPGQANGFSFSVNTGVKIPPSLHNIFREIKQEYPEREYMFNSGNLEPWFTREKIFLLNSALTVMERKPGSHMNIWQEFTDDIIQYISCVNPN